MNTKMTSTALPPLSTAALALPQRRSGLTAALAVFARTAWLPLCLVAAIWLVTVSHPSAYLPPLPSVFAAFTTSWLGEGITEQLLPSLLNFALGFLVALVLGVLFGVALGVWRTLALLLDPLLQFFRGLPGIALLPLLIITLGTSDASKIALIAFGSVWPILLNTMDGVASIAPQTREAAKSFRVTPLNVFLRLLLPATFARVSVGIRLSLSIALVMMVASEYYGATRGIGYSILLAKQQFHVAEMWAGVLMLGIIGLAINTGYGAFERHALRWRGADPLTP